MKLRACIGLSVLIGFFAALTLASSRRLLAPAFLIHRNPPEARCIHPISIMQLLMKKLLVITVAMLSGADMAMAQNTVASPNPSASPTGPPGTATAPSVVVTSEELD